MAPFSDPDHASADALPAAPDSGEAIDTRTGPGVLQRDAQASAARPRVRVQRRPVHGVLLLDKPLGWSSNDALQKAKWLLRAEKAGHTGTLDPLATGLLPLCFGAATKFSQVSLDADKAYRATLVLGARSTTGDREGEITPGATPAFDARRLLEVLAGLQGRISQLPPMHSALKKDGKALYEYARAGIEVERTPREVTIHGIDIVSWQDAELVIDVRCSKGTYVRTLAADIGDQLGCGAYLGALKRTGVGALRVDQAIPLDALEAMDEAARDALLLAPDSLLGEWPALCLPAADAGRFLSGNRRRVTHPDADALRVYGPSPTGGGRGDVAFLGSGHVRAGELIADRLLAPAEVASTCRLASGPTKRPEVATPD
ncbi:tRNA pseudouridine(55) synthase TruB [Pseudaquabacterium rugosum]|uniref:tRNA pseudouridine synthase B n=1 Tax=Pseudaquabacterium rugosum TaxID=2984194 RepID=A0ABU9B6W8_9BURK